jgi:hypothetical protein
MPRVIYAAAAAACALLLVTAAGRPAQPTEHVKAHVSAPPATGAEMIVELVRMGLDERFGGMAYIGSFDPSRNIFPVVKKGVYDRMGRRVPTLRGIPDSLSDVRVLHDFVDREQFFYQAYRSAEISRGLWNQINEGIDTTQLAGHWVDGVIISVLVGSNAAGERVVILDRNNDGDFTDEPVLSFSPDSLRLPGRQFRPITSAQSSVEFSYVEGGVEKRRTARIRFFYEEGASATQLEWQPLDYTVGTWRFRGQELTVALDPRPVLRPGKYTFLYIDVNGDGNLDPNPTGVEAYSTDEPFHIAGASWHVAEMAADGSFIRLRPADVAVAPRSALRVGHAALPFTATTLDGAPVSLEDLRGRHVLLNFSWTGCGFSLAELPYLRAARAAYGVDALAMITMVEAASPAEARRYVESHDLKWPHVHQGRSDEVGRLYRVTGTPTNYLIGPDGTILARGAALRGDSLQVTLENHVPRR